MPEWLEDRVVAIGSLNLNLKWRPGGALRWKAETDGWDGQGVVCGKSAPPRL
jgi:hypothetical protein